MTQPTEPTGPDAPEPSSSASPPPSFEQRMERFGQEAEAAGHRLAANPTVRDAADTAARVWGLIVLAVGLWFLAEFTLGIPMPGIPWRDIWPLGLIIVGLAVVFRGLRRTNA